ncbi:MAG: hypothetical protein ACTSRG_03325 [Candidatus Helarchaeota archaeon]
MVVSLDTTSDFILGYLYAGMQRVTIDPLSVILTIIGAAIVIVVALVLCWDISKQSLDDTAVVGWVIIFFIVPVISWIAYYLVIRKA